MPKTPKEVLPNSRIKARGKEPSASDIKKLTSEAVAAQANRSSKMRLEDVTTILTTAQLHSGEN